MAITLKRNTKVAGALLKFKIWVKDEQVTKIVQGEEKEITLPKEQSELQIKQLNGKSNTLLVNDGDYVAITNGPAMLWLLGVALAFVPLATLYDGTARIFSLSLAIILFFILLRSVDSYKLNKVNEQSAP